VQRRDLRPPTHVGQITGFDLLELAVGRAAERALLDRNDGMGFTQHPVFAETDVTASGVLKAKSLDYRQR